MRKLCALIGASDGSIDVHCPVLLTVVAEVGKFKYGAATTVPRYNSSQIGILVKAKGQYCAPGKFVRISIGNSSQYCAPQSYNILPELFESLHLNCVDPKYPL